MKKFMIPIVAVCVVAAVGISVVTLSSSKTKNDSHNISDYQSTSKNHNNSLLIGSKKTNQQIDADTVLDRQISGTEELLYNYTFVNGSESLDTIYVFDDNPDTLSEGNNYLEMYENNYIKKFSYLYLNGKKSSDIQVRKYTCDDKTDQPWYCDQYFYVKSQEHKNKLQAYHSYEISTVGTTYEDEYFYYTYDDGGRLAETMDDIGDVNYFYYDKQGILERRTFGVTESNYDEKTYSYEMEGKKIVKVYVRDAENGNTLNRYEYEYDSNNRISKETNYSYYNNEEKHISDTTSYSYDDNGNISKIIEKQYYSISESYRTTSKLYFYNNNNNISKIVTENEKSKAYTVFIYSDKPTEYTNEN